jgi:hypothetical protein
MLWKDIIRQTFGISNIYTIKNKILNYLDTFSDKFSTRRNHNGYIYVLHIEEGIQW